MTAANLCRRLKELVSVAVPLCGSGSTATRLRILSEIGKEDLSLAKLAEAHWDAVAILAEAGREPETGAIYAVWASEVPGEAITFSKHGDGTLISGSKAFCSGLGIVDRALITARAPKALLLDVDMRRQTDRFHFALDQWATVAFRATNTGALFFENFALDGSSIVGGENFYLSRLGFWHGACGPAACWVGGAAGLVAFAKKSMRSDPHTMAHLGAMDASIWMMEASLTKAGTEIDLAEGDPMLRALRLRHVVEQGCTEILRRFSRAYGPHPLAMNADMSRRYHELDLYLRQTHGERDLETLGRKFVF